MKIFFIIFFALLAGLFTGLLTVYAQDTKVSALPSASNPVSTDILYLVQDPAGTPSSKKITIGNLFAAEGISADATKSGGIYLEGLTSGGVAIAVADVAGTAIVYVLPSTNGVSGQYLKDAGTTTCPTLPSGYPTTCHATAWETPTAGVSDGDKGDVVVSGSGATWTVESIGGNAVAKVWIKTTNPGVNDDTVSGYLQADMWINTTGHTLYVKESTTGDTGAAVWTNDLASQASGAPTNATYLTKTAESGLSAEADLGAGSSGLLRCDISAGTCTPSTAELSGDVVTSGSNATSLAAAYKVRPCEISYGSKASGAAVETDDDDLPLICSNMTGATMTIQQVDCAYWPTGGTAPTLRPIISGGAEDSILATVSTVVTCGSGAYGTAGSLNGTPTQTNGQTIDANIVAAGGTATLIILRIKRTI